MTVDPDKICALSQELRTQDNEATTNPIFLVQERVMLDGMDIEFADETRWFLEGHDQMFTEEEAILEVGSEEALWDSNQYEPVGIVWRWEHVSTHLTRKSAEAYVQTYAHRHKHGLRVHVASQQGVEEWAQAIEYLRADSWTRWEPGVQVKEGDYWVSRDNEVLSAYFTTSWFYDDETYEPITLDWFWFMPRIVPEPPRED